MNSLKYVLHLQLGFPNWPQKPTGPTLESPQKDTGSAPASSSYGSGYGTSAMSAYQTGTDGYGYARENKEARSSGSVSSAYETGATNASGKGKSMSALRRFKCY